MKRGTRIAECGSDRAEGQRAACGGFPLFQLFVIRSAQRAPGPNHPCAALRGHVPPRDVTISALARYVTYFTYLRAEKQRDQGRSAFAKASSFA